MRLILLATIILSFLSCNAQNENRPWNGKQCAVVLTYDDALNVHLDNVIPCLDSFNIKGTFYLIGEAEVVSKRMDEWRVAAANRHELGNHSLTHPCNGQGEGRSWVSPEKDLSTYSVNRAVNEIKVTNTLLHAIDGKNERTYAYPCGDMYIDSVNYYDYLRDDFVAARGVNSSMQTLNDIDLNNVNCYMICEQSGEELIDLVKQNMESHSLLVFLFHGVGGEHNINVSLEAHSELVHFLAKHKDEIWIDTMVDVAKFVKEQ